VDYVDIDAAGRLCIDDLERKLIKYNGAVRIVSVTGAANVTGYVNPIHDIAAMVHHYSAKIMVDGAQLVPHVPVDMKPPHTPEHIDFLAFSAHKMYAPFGTGVLIGPKSDFERSDPMMRGGNAFRLYTHDQIQWSPPPKKDEAGSPNVMGVVALSAAIRTLSSLDMAKVFQYETALYDYAAERMRRIPGMRFYSDHGGDDTISIIPFNMEHIPHHIMAKILAGEAGISVRDGFFCAHPYCQRLLGLSPEEMEYFFIHEDTPLPGMVRLSMGLYNTFDEVNQLIATLSDISRNREFYMNKYNSPELRLGCSH
jgi:selenocysteine lyase/cysteine desulfurase